MIKEGSLQDFRLLDLLQILTLAGASGDLTLKRQGKHGTVSLQAGAIVGAEHANLRNSEACAQLSLWTTGIFEFNERHESMPSSESIGLKQVADAGSALLMKQNELLARLPDYFSTRSRITPQRDGGTLSDAWQTALGDGIVFGELVLQLGRGEVAVLEEVTTLHEAGRIVIDCANEEFLRRLFADVITTVANQFAAISGVKMVDALERLFNDTARARHLALRLRQGHVIDDLPDNWQTSRLLGAYRPLWQEVRGFVIKVYGEKFLERILEDTLYATVPMQHDLWRDLNQSVSTP
jgi:hypothetical protein